MHRPIILMSFGSEPGTHALPKLTMYRNYADALREQGALVLGITDPDEDAARSLCAVADGLLLTGGADLDPKLYREDPLPQCGAPDPWRDRAESAYAAAFIGAQKPILGICRGLQLLNAMLGGSLHQDLPTQLGIAHPNSSTHDVLARPGSALAEWFGPRFAVNSYHHQAIKDLAPGFVVDAVFADDERVIEAVHHETLPISAYQWHPERMRGADRSTPVGPDMGPLFAAFVAQCAARRE